MRSTARTGANGARVRTLCVATGVPGAIVDTYQYTTVAIGVINSGNTDLTPEEADTITFGFVFKPEFDASLFSDLSLSVDYYDIDISNVIAPIAGGTALSKCYNLDGTNPTYDPANPFCAALRRNPTTGGVDTVAAPYLNLGGLRTSGVDAQIDWKIPVGPGSLDLNILANFTNSYRNAAARGLGLAGVRGHDRRHAERRHSDSGLEDADVADVSAAELRRRRALAPPARDGRRHFGDAAGEPGARRAVLRPVRCHARSTNSTTRSWSAAASTT